jgi:hypothetical protein
LTRPQANRASWFLFFRHMFRHPALGPRDVAAIEFQMRRIRNMLDTYGNSSVQNVSVPGGTQGYKLGWIAKGGKQGQRLGTAANENK